MKCKFLWPMVLLAVTLSKSALAQTGPLNPGGNSANSVSLRYKFIPGNVYRYKVSIAFELKTPGDGQTSLTTSTVTGSFENTVKSVDSNGDATLSGQMHDVTDTVAINGQQVQLPQSVVDNLELTSTEVLSPLGKIISISQASPSSGGASSMMGPSTMFAYATLPDHPVKINDTWRTPVVFPTMPDPMYVKLALIGLDTSSGSTVASLAAKIFLQTTTKPAAGGGRIVYMNMTGSGSEKFDIDRGMITNMDLNLYGLMSTNAPSLDGSSDGNVGNMNITLSMDSTSNN
jgi:hypothetical protein